MTIVILAAGAARRMGRQKLLLPIDGRSMIVRVIDAASAWPTLVVASDEVAEILEALGPFIVRNASPERGMAYSLALANARIAIEEPIAVLLADLADITASTIARVLASYTDAVDVVVPRHGATLAHPVVFGPRARSMIAALPDGDSIKTLRDDPSLRRRYIDVDADVLRDIDTPADYFKRTGRQPNPVETSR